MAETPAAPLEKAVEEARKARTEYDRHRALDNLLAALDADKSAEEAEARLQAILDYEPNEVCKDEFAYDRMVEAYREVARRYFAEKGER